MRFAQDYWDRLWLLREAHMTCSVELRPLLRVGLTYLLADVRHGAGPSGRIQTRSPMQCDGRGPHIPTHGRTAAARVRCGPRQEGGTEYALGTFRTERHAVLWRGRR